MLTEFDEIGIYEAAQDLLDARKRLGYAVMERHDLWKCLEECATTPPTTNDAIPEGWKLVPVEPTPEMWAASFTYSDGDEGLVSETVHAEAWSAMLSAAPSAPATSDSADFIRDSTKAGS